MNNRHGSVLLECLVRWRFISDVLFNDVLLNVDSSMTFCWMSTR